MTAPKLEHRGVSIYVGSDGRFRASVGETALTSATFDGIRSKIVAAQRADLRGEPVECYALAPLDVERRARDLAAEFVPITFRGFHRQTGALMFTHDGVKHLGSAPGMGKFRHLIRTEALDSTLRAVVQAYVTDRKRLEGRRQRIEAELDRVGVRLPDEYFRRETTTAARVWKALRDGGAES